MGIDMSSAFDTRQRHRTLEVLHLAGCSDDDLRLVRLKWEYTDDVDFADEEREPLDAVLSTSCTMIGNWNLFVNEAKTDNVQIFLANTSETGIDCDIKMSQEQFDDAHTRMCAGINNIPVT